MTWHRHTLPTNFTIQQSRSFEGVCVPLHLMNCLFSVPDCQPIRRPSFSNRCCTVLEKSSAAYHICSVTSFLLLSLEDILLQTLLPVIVDQDRHDSINENDIYHDSIMIFSSENILPGQQLYISISTFTFFSNNTP